MSGSDKRTVTIPTPVQPLVDEGDQITVPWRAWAKWTQSGVVQIADLATRLAILEARMGVTDGSDAAPGVVGEYTSAVAGGVTVSDTIVTNIVSLDLAAGDWEVFGNVVFVLPAGAYTLLGVGMGSVDSYITVSFLSPSDQAMNTGWWPRLSAAAAR
jgi:hypothetical protein